MNKALYGTLEAAKLWFNHIINVLTNLGYTQVPREPCVLIKRVSGKRKVVIVLYVDDLFLRGNNKFLTETVDKLTAIYKEVKVTTGKIHSYLGMLFDFRVDGEVKITMIKYIADILDMCATICGTRESPGGTDLFVIDKSSPLLDKTTAKFFHSLVMKIMYVAKRVRVDCLLVVGFLATRTTQPTVQDYKKLCRLIRYIRDTRDLGIVLKPNDGVLQIHCSVDASFAVHADAKSHTGVVLSLGDGPVYVSSKKQHIVTKSSTQAELVGGTDDVPGLIEQISDLLHGMDEEFVIPDIKQDNQSTMQLIINGDSNSLRTRHINIRYFFLKQLLDEKKATMSYMPSEEMIADYLTKPKQGQAFLDARARLMNWYY
jgi:hypothetical protein